MAEEKSRVCSKCGEEKEIEEFVPCKPSQNKTGRRGTCRQCQAAYSRAWQKKNKKKYQEINKRWRDSNKASAQRSQRARRHGMTLEELDAVWNTTDGACFVCGKKDDPKKMHIDHDHKDGSIRGLLCHGCNIGMGHFRDDPEALQAAADYLRKEARFPATHKKGTRLTPKKPGPKRSVKTGGTRD